MRRLAALALLAAPACSPRPSAEPGPIAEPPPAPAAPPAPSPAPVEAPVAAAPEPPAPEACKCPPDASDDDDDAPDDAIDDDDPGARTRRARARKKLARTLAARVRAELPDHAPACDVALSGPCSVRGDFDGDGLGDDAVLVRDARRRGGLVFLWGKGGAELLGGGRRGRCWAVTEVPDADGTAAPAGCPEEIDVDFDWLARWDLRPREVRDDGPVLVHRAGRRASRAPGALGDGLLVDGGDSAAVLYRSEGGWTLMYLGY